jgi:hypothetical protein
LHNVRVTGEAGSADEDGAQKSVDSFDSLIKEGYLPEQIFNVDETGLQWKRMPNRTYLHQEARSICINFYINFRIYFCVYSTVCTVLFFTLYTI